MQIHNLKIKDYKILVDFEINFQKSISLFIGMNGSGKSTLLEAITWIFRSANLNFVEGQKDATPFDFEITYTIRLEDVIEETSTSSEFETNYIAIKLVGDGSKKDFWSFETDNSKYSTAELIKKYGYEKLLPSNLLIYYSGWFETMQVLCHDHEEIFKKKLREGKSDIDVSISSAELYTRIKTLPLLYIQKYHFEILLASLFAFEYNDRVDKFFHDVIKISKPEVITLSIDVKKRQWKQGKGSEDFWGASGQLLQFLQVLKSYSSNPLNNEESGILSLVFDLRNWYSIREFYGEEKKIFYLLHMLHASDMLKAIQVFLEKPDFSISHRHLSDGEQQLITIEAINELLIENNTILLFDEPDTYLHPEWQSGFFDTIILGCIDNDFNVKYPESYSHLIVTTHSPMLISNLRDGDVFNMVDGKAFHYSGSTFGKDSNTILSQTMESISRTKKVSIEIETLENLIKEGKFEEAKIKIKDLSEVLGEAEPTLIRLSSIIKRKEIIGR